MAGECWGTLMNELEMRHLLQRARDTSMRIRITFKDAEGIREIPTLIVMGQIGEISVSSEDVQALRNIFAAHSWGAHARTFELTLREPVNVERFVRDLLPVCEALEVI
jgi:hypothetical protein